MQQLVGRLERLFEPLPRLGMTDLLPHSACGIAFGNGRQRPWRPDTAPRKLSVSLDLFSRTASHRTDSGRLRNGCWFSDDRGNGILDTAHKLARMPPAMR